MLSQVIVKVSATALTLIIECQPVVTRVDSNHCRLLTQAHFESPISLKSAEVVSRFSVLYYSQLYHRLLYSRGSLTGVRESLGVLEPIPGGACNISEIEK